jgi:hypothetical protein
MINIKDYVCNLIAGNYYISDLYFSVDRARDIVNKDNNKAQFQHKITFQGIGSKVYKSSKLVELENLSFCLSYQIILSQINNIPTLDQYIILLLKGRNEIRKLYQACCKAKSLRQDAKIFCYTFINPFGSLADVNNNKLSFKNAYEFINYFCLYERKKFDPILIFNGILSKNI